MAFKFNAGNNCGCCGCISPAWTVYHANVSPKYHIFNFSTNVCNLNSAIIGTNVPLFYVSESGNSFRYAWCQAFSGYQGYGMGSPVSFSGIIELDIDFLNEPVNGIFPINSWLKKAKVTNLYISGQSFYFGGGGSNLYFNSNLSFTEGEGLAYSPIYCNTEFSGHLPGFTMNLRNTFQNIDYPCSVLINPLVAMAVPAFTSGKAFVCDGATGVFAENFGCPLATASTSPPVTGATSYTYPSYCGNGVGSIVSDSYLTATRQQALITFHSYQLSIQGYFYSSGHMCSGRICSGIYNQLNAGNLWSFCSTTNILNGNSGGYTEAKLKTCECDIVTHSYASGTESSCYNLFTMSVTGDIPFGFVEGEVYVFDCNPNLYVKKLDDYAFYEFSGHRLPNDSFARPLNDINYSFCNYMPHSGIYLPVSSATGLISCYTLCPENPILARILYGKAEVSGTYKAYGVSGFQAAPDLPRSGITDVQWPSQTPCGPGYSCPAISGHESWNYFDISGYEFNRYAMYVGNNNGDNRHIFGDLSSGNFFKVPLDGDSYEYDVDLGDIPVLRCHVITSITPCAYVWNGGEVSLRRRQRVGRYGQDVDVDFSFISLSANNFDSCEP